MIIFSYQASNNYVFDGFRRNTVVSYQENLEPTERKRKYDLREIWNVIFYIVKTDCQWRILPSSFAP